MASYISYKTGSYHVLNLLSGIIQSKKTQGQIITMERRSKKILPCNQSLIKDQRNRVPAISCEWTDIQRICSPIIRYPAYMTTLLELKVENLLLLSAKSSPPRPADTLRAIHRCTGCHSHLFKVTSSSPWNIFCGFTVRILYFFNRFHIPY